MNRTKTMVLLAAIAAGAAACGSSGSAATNDGGVPGGAGITWKDNGNTMTAAFATANRVKAATQDMVQVVGSTATNGVALIVSSPPPLVPGSYSCGIGPNQEIASFAYTSGDASSGAPTCTVDIDTLGDGTGTKVTGTFSAMLTLDDGTAKTITNGTFDVALIVMSL
jgi:hypothetical protein